MHNKDKRVRLQSATEYLMTYGWSILLIAIVLTAIFELGAFNVNPLSSSNTCLPQPGYSCSKLLLNSTGIINATVGQETGSQEIITGVGCSNSSAMPSSISSITPVTLASGQSISLSFRCPIPSGTVGSAFSGTLWIQYTSHSVSSQTTELGTVNAKVSTSSPVGAVSSYNYAYVATYKYPGNIIIVNTTTNTISGYMALGSLFGEIQGIAIAPSGTYAYATSFLTSNILIISTATDTITGVIQTGFSNPDPTSVAFSPSGSFAYVTNWYANNVVIINTGTNMVTGAVSGFPFNEPSGVSFSPTGGYAYVVNAGNGNVIIVNTTTNSAVGSINSGFSWPYKVAIAPSGTYAYVTDYLGTQMFIVSTATKTVTGSITSGFNDPYGVGFSPSGSFAYVTNDNSANVVIVNTATNTVVGSIGGVSQGEEIAFPP